MIKSKLANVLLGIFGASFLAASAFAIVESVKARDPGGAFGVVVFLALGSWSFFGALKNLGSSNREIPRLRTYAVAKANVIAICVLLPSCMLANIYKDEIVRLGGVTDKLAVAVCEGFGFSLVAVPVVLLAHVIAKASHRETAKSESNPSAA